MSNPHTKSGWLLKWTNVLKRYRKRWFIVQNNLLSYYGNPEAVGRNCRGTFELQNASLDTRPSQTSFILTEHSGRKHHLKAVSEKDKESWINVLSSAIRSANLINDNDWDSSSIDSNFIARTQGIESGNHDSGGLTTRQWFFRNRWNSSRKPLSSSPRSSPNLSHEFQVNITRSIPSQPVFGILSNPEHAHTTGQTVKERPSHEETQSISVGPVNALTQKDVTSRLLSEHDDDPFSASKLIGRFVRLYSSTDLSTVTNVLVSVGVLRKRLTEHTQSVCSQVAQIESLLTSGNISDMPTAPVHAAQQHHQSSSTNHVASSDLLAAEHMSDDPKKALHVGGTGTAPIPASTSACQTVDLKALLADHRTTVKEFETICTDALQYVVGNLERWQRRVQTEQERCLALERTVEQLARQHRALEQQLSNCYITTSPSVASRPTSDCYNVAATFKSGGTLQRVKRASIKSRHSVGAASSTDEEEFYDVSSCEEDFVARRRAEAAEPGETTTLLGRTGQAFDTAALPEQPQPRKARIPSTGSWESFSNLYESSDSLSEEQPCPDVTTNTSVLVPAEAQTVHQAPERPSPSNLSVARVRRTTVPYSPKVALNLWSIIKNGIGKDITKIPLPVNFNEPISFLQRASEDLAYSSLLDQASECRRDPASQMALVAAFAVSCYATTAERTGKPFNPLLGETYELDRTMDEGYGWRLVAEQVSHHPPGSALYCESLGHGWSLWLEFILVSKFRGKYMSVFPKGTVNLVLPDGSRYSWTKVNTLVHNLIVGSLWIDNYGEALVQNHTNGYKCLLRFIPHSYFSRGPQRQVTGDVQNAEGTTEMLVRGHWDSHIDCQRAQPNGKPVEEPKRLWTADRPLPDADQIYHFTRFAVTLNEPEQGLPPTDSRLRPDQRMMEDGLWDQANEEKRRLENKQRAVRHCWEEARALPDAKNEPLYTPRWFAVETDPVTGVTSHVYTNKYWQAKAKQDWACCPDIF